MLNVGRLKIVVVLVFVFVVVIESSTMDDNDNDNEHTSRECNKVEPSFTIITSVARLTPDTQVVQF